MIEPNKLGKIRYSKFAFNKNTIIGFEPAGGWTVLVNNIIEIAVANAKAIDHHSFPNVCKNIRPTNVDKKCPKITFLGWENGLLGNPNNKTHDAPNEPIINKLS